MREDNKKEEVFDTSVSQYGKSNFLIGAKYRSSLLENKIMAISLAKIQRMEFVDKGEKGGLVCELKASELRQLLGANQGSFYSQLRPVAETMTSRTIGMTDPENNRFRYMSIIQTAEYEDGIFRIKYNYDLKQYINNLQSNFTLLELPIMLQFNSVYSFRLYELLRSKAYFPKGMPRSAEKFKIDFQLSELRLNMGVVNAELDTVRRILDQESAPDYDKAVEKSPEKLFGSWYEFKRKVLDVAIREINDKSDIFVEINPIKSGRGARVHAVEFYVSYKKAAEAECAESEVEVVDTPKELTEDERMEFYFSVKEIAGRLSLADIKAVSEASNYNIDRIRNAYEMMEESSTDIENEAGWLIAALKNNYQRTSRKKDFNNFQGRNKSKAEMDILTEMLIKKDMQ